MNKEKHVSAPLYFFTIIFKCVKNKSKLHYLVYLNATSVQSKSGVLNIHLLYLFSSIQFISKGQCLLMDITANMPQLDKKLVFLCSLWTGVKFTT